jgi:hypothetical protein
MDSVLFLQAFYSPIFIVFDPLTLFCLFIFSVLLGWGISMLWQSEPKQCCTKETEEELTEGYRPKLSFKLYSQPNGGSSVFSTILPPVDVDIPMPKGVKPPKNPPTTVGGVKVESLGQGLWNLIPKPRRK